MSHDGVPRPSLRSEFLRAERMLQRAVAAEGERDHLRRWKQEASLLFDGLQDLGRALDLPLGVLVTGPRAIEAANALRAELDALRKTVARVEALANEAHALDEVGDAWISVAALRAALGQR